MRTRKLNNIVANVPESKLNHICVNDQLLLWTLVPNKNRTKLIRVEKDFGCISCLFGTEHTPYTRVPLVGSDWKRTVSNRIGTCETSLTQRTGRLNLTRLNYKLQTQIWYSVYENVNNNNNENFSRIIAPICGNMPYAHTRTTLCIIITIFRIFW